MNIFGYASNELIGQNIGILISAIADGVTTDAFKALLQQLIGLRVKLEGQRKDGSTFPMYISTNEVILDHHKVYTAVIQDFTERKFMELQMWDKERLNIELIKERELRDVKNRFISMMSTH